VVISAREDRIFAWNIIKLGYMNKLVSELGLTIVIPCLNEAETLEKVIEKAKFSILKSGMFGEVIVADNGSTDGSQQIAATSGAKVLDVPVRGYGAALQAGIAAATGKYVIIGDADDSYAFDELGLFIEKLEMGYDLVMGDRFAGGIEKGAMPWLHKYIGNPILSYLGRTFFKVPINDFHCGLRGFKRESMQFLNLSSTGMEFASEMVVKAALNNLKITQVPTTLKLDGRLRGPHLRTWRDGWRHLIFLLAASPRWLFLYPGISLLAFGILGMILTSRGVFTFQGLHFDLNTYFISVGTFLVGTQTVLLSMLARIFSTNYGILPKSKSISWFDKKFTLERGILLGGILIFTALIGFGILFINWTGSGFRNLNSGSSLRITGLFILTLSSGIQILFASFFASILQASRGNHI